MPETNAIALATDEPKESKQDQHANPKPGEYSAIMKPLNGTVAPRLVHAKTTHKATASGKRSLLTQCPA